MKEATTEASDQAVDRMQQLVLEIVQALVDDPDAVSVDVTVHSVCVSPSDIGKVIGKQGRTARSLRTILGAASMKLHHRFALDIVEDDEDEDEDEAGDQPISN